MTSHASTSSALDCPPGPTPGSEAWDQNTVEVQETGSQETVPEVLPSNLDVESLIQEAAVSAMQLRLAARIIVRGAARLASGSASAPEIGETLD